MESVNATTTETLVNAAKRLVHELPPGTPPEQVGAHLIASAKRDDAARGVVWPEIDPAQMTAAGFDWHVFPNTVIMQQPTNALCYRARPNGYNPDSCIFEVYVLERFPEGEEPKTQWVFQPEPTEENWLKILSQDFQNMPRGPARHEVAAASGRTPESRAGEGSDQFPPLARRVHGHGRARRDQIGRLLDKARARGGPPKPNGLRLSVRCYDVS